MRNPCKTLRFASVLLLFTVTWAHAQQMMLRVEGESIAGRKVVLPDAAKGHVAVLVLGFTKASKTPTSAWGSRIASEFGSQSGFELYQLPVLEDVPRLIRGMVVSGMKKGVKENMRDHFVPLFEHESELKKLVGYREPDDAYLVVLDPSGEIVDQVHGTFSDALYARLREALHKLLAPQLADDYSSTI